MLPLKPRVQFLPFQNVSISIGICFYSEGFQSEGNSCSKQWTLTCWIIISVAVILTFNSLLKKVKVKIGLHRRQPGNFIEVINYVTAKEIGFYVQGDKR